MTSSENLIDTALNNVIETQQAGGTNTEGKTEDGSHGSKFDNASFSLFFVLQAYALVAKGSHL